MNEAQSQSMTAVLSDGAPNQAGSLKVRVTADSSTVSIFPERYGDFGSADGHGCPVFLELYEGRLRLVVFADINEQDPTIIDLDGAREARRIEKQHPLGQCEETTR